MSLKGALLPERGPWRFRWIFWTPAAFVGSMLIVVATAEPLRADPPASPMPIAVIGDTTIDSAQLDRTVGDRLLRLRMEEYELKRQALEKIILDTLLRREAASRGIAVETLVRSEVDAKLPPVTKEEVQRAYRSGQEHDGTLPEAVALKQIESSLRLQRAADRRAEFITALKRKAGVRILLEPPRFAVATGSAPSRGPVDAPVTIVEFSDFQCPFCRRAAETLKAILDHYGPQVRVVFRNLPLPMHPDAQRAAEAALCANEQGRFWEMHELLFQNQAQLQAAALPKYAVHVGLNEDKFAACVDSRRYGFQVRTDSDEATKYGISGTPTFFINGRFFSGALPYESFTQVIDEELDAAARTPASMNREETR